MANFVDPFGLIRQTFSVARWTERQLVELFGGGHDPGEDPSPAAIAANPAADSLSAKMNRLLDRALDQSTTSSQVELFHHILDQLVADEARIIGALSDGSSSPLVTVHDGVRRGGAGRAVLENASLIGRIANVALPAMVPTYVGHLLSLGLVEIGPEAPDLKQDYEVLMAESVVLGA